MKKLLSIFALLAACPYLQGSYEQNYTALQNFYTNMHQGICPVGEESMQGHEILNAKQAVLSQPVDQKNPLKEEKEITTNISMHALQSFMDATELGAHTNFEQPSNYHDKE